MLVIVRNAAADDHALQVPPPGDFLARLVEPPRQLLAPKLGQDGDVDAVEIVALLVVAADMAVVGELVEIMRRHRDVALHQHARGNGDEPAPEFDAELPGGKGLELAQELLFGPGRHAGKDFELQGLHGLVVARPQAAHRDLLFVFLQIDFCHGTFGLRLLAFCQAPPAPYRDEEQTPSKGGAFAPPHNHSWRDGESFGYNHRA